jgi:hypothetical protein
MDKSIIKASEIKAAYMEANGCHADEIVGAQDAEMRDELIADGFRVEAIPTPAPRPISTPATKEELAAFASFFRTITVPDGYTGKTVDLDATHVVRRDAAVATLHVVGNVAWIGTVRLVEHPWLADLPIQGPDPRESLIPREVAP